MAILLPISGAIQVLEYIRLNIIDPLAWEGQLYVNNVTPDLNSVAADFTPAADMNTIAMFDYYGAANTDSGVGAKITASDFIFEMTADTAQTAYGWFVTDLGGTIIFAERFAASIALAYTGDKVKITAHVFKYHNG